MGQREWEKGGDGRMGQYVQNKHFSEYIDQFRIWDPLSAAERELLLSHTRFMRYVKGTTVHHGALGSVGTMHVKSGCLRVYIFSEDGRELTMYFIRPGDISVLAATSFMERTDTVYIDAHEDTEVFFSDTRIVRRILSGNLRAQCNVYELAVRHLSEMVLKFQHMMFLSADRRLAQFLIDESLTGGTDEICLTHEQIARYLGTAREVISRMIKDFSQEGIVQTARGRIRILNRQALHQRVGG